MEAVSLVAARRALSMVLGSTWGLLSGSRESLLAGFLALLSLDRSRTHFPSQLVNVPELCSAFPFSALPALC